MKKLLLILIAALTLTNAKAQNKGDILLYGGVNFSAQKDAYDKKQSYLYLSAGAGYFINEHWAAGVFCNFANNTSLDTGAAAIKYGNTSVTVGPFVRYSKKLSDIFFLFGQLDLGYSSSRAHAGGVVVPNSQGTGLYAMFTPAVGINVHKGFALNFGIGGVGYNSRKGATDPKASGEIAFNFGKTLQIGISKFFNTSKKAVPQTP